MLMAPEARLTGKINADGTAEATVRSPRRVEAHLGYVPIRTPGAPLDADIDIHAELHKNGVGAGPFGTVIIRVGAEKTEEVTILIREGKISVVSDPAAGGVVRVVADGPSEVVR